ncbi:sensor domain-containing phosphodiesterase [Pseudomonas oryzihabitans]|uniref:sensor domain-containing phosphodiesterase n=1 Tax=Pseudomonas oryzihabitans TaxID=47885 RepID=UPI003D071D37
MRESGTELLDVVGLDTGNLSSQGCIDKVLHALRTHLDMDVAFLAEFRQQDRVFRNVDAEPDAPIKAGDALPLSQGYCQQVVTGHLPELIPDTRAVGPARLIPETRSVPIGAHVSVPVRLSDGELYGTFCCFKYQPDPTLSPRDLELVRTFAELVADRLSLDVSSRRGQVEMRERIQGAVAAHQPSIVYQPIYHLADLRIAGWESLSRFHCLPQRSPDLWFSEASAVGLGDELEESAMRFALQGLQSLPDDSYLTMNCSPQTILGGRLPALLAGTAPGRLVLEITEHAEVEDYDALHAQLQPLRAQGVRLAIDDAGAGYSSLRHILRLRPDMIKLDMSLVRDIDRDAERRALASAIIAFARETHKEVIAEGVETLAELEALKALQVDKVQGNLLSRPLPRDDALRLPRRRQLEGQADR